MLQSKWAWASSARARCGRGGPSRPVCPRWPHCPTTSCAPSPRRLRRLLGRGRGVRRAGPRRPRRADPRRDVDLVVVTVKLPHHHRLVGEALAAGKLVMCEWPLGVDAGQTADLAARAAGAGLGTLIGLQARMAPSIRYARDLVAQGYVGEVLATTLVGSGIAWTSVADSAHAYMFEAAGNATLLSVPTMHALDALQFVLGDLADIRATSAVRRPAVTLADTQETITATAPDHLAIAATLKSGAVASVFYRGGTSRGDNFRWEINGTEGDLVLTSPVGNLQVLAPRLEGGAARIARPRRSRFRPRTIWRPVLRKARRQTSRASTPPLPPIAAPARPGPPRRTSRMPFVRITRWTSLRPRR